MANASTCYTISNNGVYSYNLLAPCGGSSTSGATAQSCCNAGDYCMADGICHFTQLGIVNGTGYYMAGCTDPTWQDPACPKQCTAEYQGDIIYNRDAGYWNCCKSDGKTLNCQQPSNFVVRAPAPQDLSTTAHLTTPVPSSTLVSSIAIVTIPHSNIVSSAAPSNTAAPNSHHTTVAGSSVPASNNSGHLTTGAKAGIGVAVIAGVALIFGGAYFFYRRSKRRHEEFKNFNDADSHYSVRNRSHHTIPSLRSTRRDTYATTATTATTRADTNRNTYTTTRSTTYNTDRNTYASSYYSADPTSPHNQPEPPPPLPEGADGIQVVKQLPRTPDEHLFAQNREKPAVEVDAQSKQQGPFEMHDEGIEMQTRQRPLSMQELEGTTVAPAELDARSVRSSNASRLAPSVRAMQDEELAREMGLQGGMEERDAEESSTQQLREGSRRGSGESERRDET